MPEQPEFEVVVRTVAAEEQERLENPLPHWSEIELSFMMGGYKKSALLTRKACEVTIDALHEVLHPWAGQSVYESIWEEMDRMIDQMIDDKDDLTKPQMDDLKSRSYGMSVALAHLMNPYNPDVDLVREEAMRRRVWRKS